MEVLTHLQAWDAFYLEFRQSDKWDTLTLGEKNRLINADRDRRNRREVRKKIVNLGYDRARSIIEQYAPDMFEWVEGAIKKDQK